MRLCFVEESSECINEGDNIKVEVAGQKLGNIARTGRAIVMLSEMCNIWREIGDRKIIHAFIEARVSGDFNLGGFDVVPKNVASSAGNAAEEDSFPSIWQQLCFSFTWRSNPHTAAKGADAGEVFSLSS